MSDAAPPPPSGGAPRFRIVQGRGLGERAPAPATTVRESSEPRIPHVQSAPQVQMASQQPSPMPQAPQQPPQQVQQQPTPPQQPMGSPVLTPAQQLVLGQAGGQQVDDQVVMKCVRFFKTLINLSQQPEQQQEGVSQRQTAARVNELVTNVIFGAMAAEDFTRSLQEALKSQAQPHLLPFLQKTLPHLREAIRNGDVVIEGINPPPDFVMNARPASGGPPSAPVVSHPPPLPMVSQAPQFVAAPTPPIPQVSAGVPTQPPPMQHSQEPRHPEPMDTEDSRPDEDVIQVRQLQESALKSALLRPEDIMKKITNRMNEACFVEEEVLTLISDAAEYRLREMLTELAVLADHRMDPIRLNPNYGPIDNTKAQIRFLEDLDRQQQEQCENRAKEELIRMSKGKGIGKETIEKAKEMQRADAEAKRNRDANAAAIAALSSKSSRKWDGVAGSGGGGHVTRPRTIRVNLRDLHVLANNDPLCARTQLLHKLALGGGVQADSI